MGRQTTGNRLTSRDSAEENVPNQKTTKSNWEMVECATCIVSVKKRFFSNYVNSNNNQFTSKHTLDNLEIIATDLRIEFYV